MAETVPVIATRAYVDSGLATRVKNTIFGAFTASFDSFKTNSEAFQNRPGGFSTAEQGAKADSAAQPSALDNYMQKSGGIMTGMLVLSEAPTEDLHAATKRYIDAAVAGLDTSATTNVYDFGAYQGIYAGSMANWMPDNGGSMTIKKIGSGEVGEIAVRVPYQIVCITPKELTPGAFIRIAA
ncbi:MAG: hypothetical protein LBB08_02125 [Rickettsiales bacterium]|nr:hypothetical protein [Rickettsiales bacterium]